MVAHDDLQVVEHVECCEDDQAVTDAEQLADTDEGVWRPVLLDLGHEPVHQAEDRDR